MVRVWAGRDVAETLQGAQRGADGGAASARGGGDGTDPFHHPASFAPHTPPPGRGVYTPATRCVFRVFAQRVERWSDGVGDQGADEACVTNGVYPSMAAGCGVVF